MLQKSWTISHRFKMQNKSHQMELNMIHKAAAMSSHLQTFGPKGRVSDDRERSKCSMVTGGVWGNMATYFWGLFGVDG
jgi:hypothetical protein